MAGKTVEVRRIVRPAPGELLGAPKLRHRRARSQAYVVPNCDPIYFSRHEDRETTQRSDHVIAEWWAAGRQLPVEAEEITAKQVVARFLVRARDWLSRYEVELNRRLAYSFSLPFRLCRRTTLEGIGAQAGADIAWQEVRIGSRERPKCDGSDPPLGDGAHCAVRRRVEVPRADTLSLAKGLAPETLGARVSSGPQTEA